ncbi:MAG TPA: P1 family peptidase [Pedomonas sp.]|uniref:P1 family peptidase n=1 Tax=Pedomonas sp. TaxID=2976421 RepID=UPI002F40CA1F
MKEDRFTDIPGLKVGHAHDAAVRTGVSVILPDRPVTMAVDVRGGGPGTRETDALAPHTLVERFHGLVLSGGSAFGLGAADAVTAWLSHRGVGLPVGGRPVPVVPAAILFDLSNGGNKDWGMTPPYHRLALEACAAAGTDCPHGPVGAGYGARAGSRPGGIGTASIQCERTGWRVAALIAVNSFGEVYAGEPPLDAPVALPKAAIAGTNTTIGAVATDAPLTKAQTQKLAQMAQDGLARVIRPIHTPFDGDTLFALATGEADRDTAGVQPLDLAVLGTLAADCVARAVRRGVGL